MLQFGDGTRGTRVTARVRPEARRGRWGVGGVHHVALGVETEAQQLMWKRRLEDAGVPVTGPYDRKWFHSIYFTDPDGQVVEIATSGPGYAVDEPMDALGEVVVDPGDDRLRGKRDEAAIRARTHVEPVPEIVPAMALRGIHHITGLTDDAARAEAFYGGATIQPHSTLTLFEWKGSGYRARQGTGQAERIVFRVPDGDVLGEVRERLLGMDVTVAQSENESSALAFRAPDGQPLAVRVG